MITLKNEKLEVLVKESGAELTSIKGLFNNLEYLWTGDEAFWGRHAPILFPIVGKVFNNKITIGTDEFSLSQHGFARDLDFKILNKTSTSVSLSLQSNEYTLKKYPYKFELIINYELIINSVKVTYIVKNLNENNMIFSIGAHPGFNCPLNSNEKFEDYYFEFDKNESSSLMVLNKDGYFEKEEIPYLNNEKHINFTKDLFKNDALVFNKLSSQKIYLKSKKSSNGVSLDFKGFPYLGLWSKPTGAPFVCIEPWFGHADFNGFTGEFKDKEGTISLEPHKDFSCEYTISVF